MAVRRTTSGLLKLVSPNGEYTKETVRKCLEYALEVRRRIKEQLKKIGGMEFYDVHFSYIDLEDGVERFVPVPEQSGGAAKQRRPQALTLASFIALCSAALTKPVQSQLAVMGDMSLGGTVVQVRNLAECMQVAFDAGAKRILLPMSSVVDIATVPGELFAEFQTSFYSDPVDAVFKALGVE